MTILGLPGRKILDTLKHNTFIKSRFRLPCPPYESPAYWDRVYKDLEPNDVHEWGAFDLQNGLLNFRYDVPKEFEGVIRKMGNWDAHTSIHRELQTGSSDGVLSEGEKDGEELLTSTFAQLMGITQCQSPDEASQKFSQQISSDARRGNTSHSVSSSETEEAAVTSAKNEAILLLGSGNSRFGEQILLHSFIGPVINIDVSHKVIQSMLKRYKNYLEEAPVKRMKFIVDDATTGLTSLEPNSIGGGVVDKGLVDALYCSLKADENTADLEGHTAKLGANLTNPSRLRARPPRNRVHVANNNNDPIQNIIESVHRVLAPSRPFVLFSKSEPEYLLHRMLMSNENDGNMQMDANSKGQEPSNDFHKRLNMAKWKDVQVFRLVDLQMLMYRFVKAEEGSLERFVQDEEKKLSTIPDHVTTLAYKKKLKKKRR